jgi:hypothetical protein
MVVPAMKTFRLTAFAIASLTLFGSAFAEIRSIQPTQMLTKPASPNYFAFGQEVAIDGGYIIVLAISDSTQAALLYRRNASDGKWVYRRTLLSVNSQFNGRGDVRMKNGIAVVQIGGDEAIFELKGGDYVRSTSAAPIHHPGGIAISGNSILIGGNDCDYDAVVYQKGADGNWGITGRMDDNQGQCRPEGLAVELNYDYALLSAPSLQRVAAWRRNGAALDWVPAGSLPPLGPNVPVSETPYALQKSTAVAPGSFVFQRTGNTWTQTGQVVPVDYGNGAGEAFDVVYRDGVLVTSESSGIFAHPFLYVETAPGKFEHVAILEVSNVLQHHDISGKTVVAAIEGFGADRSAVEVFDLPTELHVPRPIVNDFELHDVSGFTFNSGQFALAARGTNDVLAQSNTSGLAVALVADSDWPDVQRVEADIAPSFGTADSWAGLVARYVDANNYYYVTLRGDHTFRVYRKVDGVDTLLREEALNGTGSWHVALTVNANIISVSAGNQFQTSVTTINSGAPQLKRGRAGLITSQARADFDGVHVAAADKVLLLENDYTATGAIYGRPFTEIGGNWHVPLDEQSNNAGLVQSDKSGDAVAVTGTPVENQDILTRVRLDSFGAAPRDAWFGLMARYVDAGNHYYVTARRTNQIQIRKVVNGMVTVLAAANFTPVPGQNHDLRFRVINDQLQLFVDNVMVASAHDSDIARGKYGIATYRTAATWDGIVAFQP